MNVRVLKAKFRFWDILLWQLWQTLNTGVFHSRHSGLANTKSASTFPPALPHQSSVSAVITLQHCFIVPSSWLFSLVWYLIPYTLLSGWQDSEHEKWPQYWLWRYNFLLKYSLHVSSRVFTWYYFCRDLVLKQSWCAWDLQLRASVIKAREYFWSHKQKVPFGSRKHNAGSKLSDQKTQL